LLKPGKSDDDGKLVVDYKIAFLAPHPRRTTNVSIVAGSVALQKPILGLGIGEASEEVVYRFDQNAFNRSVGSNFLPSPEQHGHDPLGTFVRQWAQQHGINHAEDRCVGPDAERQREHGHGDEAGVLQQLAEGE